MHIISCYRLYLTVRQGILETLYHLASWLKSYEVLIFPNSFRLAFIIPMLGAWLPPAVPEVRRSPQSGRGSGIGKHLEYKMAPTSEVKIQSEREKRNKRKGENESNSLFFLFYSSYIPLLLVFDFIIFVIFLFSFVLGFYLGPKTHFFSVLLFSGDFFLFRIYIQTYMIIHFSKSYFK